MRKLLSLLLLSALVSGQEAKDKSLAAWSALDKGFKKAQSEYYAARRKGESAENPVPLYAAKLEEFVKRNKGTAGAVRALGALFRYAPTDERKAAALDSLLNDHIKLPEVKNVLYAVRYARWTDRAGVLRKIAAKSPHREVKGNAMLQLGWVLKYDKPDEALGILEGVVKEYGDLAAVVQQANAEIFEITRLSVGKVAPDIVGEDLFGEPMMLSRFRGRVVFLDFWGDW